MNWLTIILTISGLCLFEAISSIDNAIINAEIASTMGARARKWFLTWGLFFAVFVVRGLLPWLIVWLTTPSIGPINAFIASFSPDPSISQAIHRSAPILLTGGGTFLVFLFFHWLLQEEKHYGLPGERFAMKHGIWFYAITSIFLCVLVWFSIKIDALMALGAVVGSTAFFITNGFKLNAELQEKQLIKSHMPDLSKIFYLEVIDATFSIDGVLGAFAFTLSVPIILAGNGLGAILVRQLTVSNIDRVKKYIYLKNGAMYSILFLGIIMILEGFRVDIPSWVSPVITFGVIGYFFFRSRKLINK